MNDQTYLNFEYKIPNHSLSIIGKSPKLKKELRMVTEVSDTQSNVLIQGESGTGKELIARAIHSNSSREGKPFVVVNSGAIPENLLESELFGYEKGAFTGARELKPGKFELANEGTMFLDEIGDMAPFLQCKILRALQQQEIERLGSTETIHVNVRIVSATNKNLLKLIKQGMFRRDLFYRLNTIRINLPPLRERLEDIPILADYFLKYFSKREQKEIKKISTRVLGILQTYKWPGNVRELENVIERAVILCHDKTIDIEHLPPEIVSHENGELKSKCNFVQAVNEFKKLLIRRTLNDVDGNKAEAARQLGLNRSYFFKLLKDFKLQ
ncbi:MAG: hypothetical protein GF353_13505 [Candidatus Lokiarchaeota archaeon]|nr:hypothetical protein [Candidatus Lokiarchaeota archaeon]